MTTTETPPNFIKTHCYNCKSGWTRITDGKPLTICFFDRQPIDPALTSCDRHETRPIKEN